MFVSLERTITSGNGLSGWSTGMRLLRNVRVPFLSLLPLDANTDLLAWDLV